MQVLVVGGGLVGASLALALAHQGQRVALVASAATLATCAPIEPTWDQRIYAVSPGNAAFLGGLGVWSRVDAARVQAVAAMAIWGDAQSHLGFAAEAAGLRELAWIVESRALQAALAAEIAATPELTVLADARPVTLDLTLSPAVLRLDSGEQWSADLVVGADGGQSWVREAAAIPLKSNDYQQLGVVANFAISAQHGAVARQWFRPDGVLALLPLPGQRVSMVWSTPIAHANALLALSPEDLANAVQAASLGTVGVLESLSPAVGFPLSLQQAQSLVAPGLALVGDAAHRVHPLAGQGVNLGFRDVRELVAVLAARPPLQSCGDYPLLQRYARARLEDIASIAWGGDALQKLFATQAPLLASVRNQGLRMVEHMPSLKRWLMQRVIA